MFQRTEQKVDLAATASSVKDTMNKTVTNVKKMNIFSLASAGILVVALLLAVIGLTGPMYTKEESDPYANSVTDVSSPVKYKGMVFLFKTTLRSYNKDDDYVDKNTNRWCSRSTGKIDPTNPDSGKHCNKDEDMWMAAYAFGIIGVVCIGVALVTTLGSELLPARVPRLSSPVFIILAWIALIISWAIAVAKYSNSPLCENPNPFGTSAPSPDREYDIDYGLALLITAWCLVGVAFCVNVGGLVMSLIGNKGETTATNQVHPAPVPAPAPQLSDVAPPVEAAAEVNQPSAVAN